jgi:hypothetical protein
MVKATLASQSTFPTDGNNTPNHWTGLKTLMKKTRFAGHFANMA